MISATRPTFHTYPFNTCSIKDSCNYSFKTTKYTRKCTARKERTILFVFKRSFLLTYLKRDLKFTHGTSCGVLPELTNHWLGLPWTTALTATAHAHLQSHLPAQLGHPLLLQQANSKERVERKCSSVSFHGISNPTS